MHCCNCCPAATWLVGSCRVNSAVHPADDVNPLYAGHLRSSIIWRPKLSSGSDRLRSIDVTPADNDFDV
jgi:hypothetical protein